MAVTDLFLEGMARGWQVLDARQLEDGSQLHADVIIIGSGAGGATAAETLSAAGLRVLVLEEGPLKTSSDFRNDEARAYAELYQEGGMRVSRDGGIAILQGRAVGGTTTVNWTSSFRTPAATLRQWAEVHQVSGHDEDSLAPWFERIEQRLGISPWKLPPNANNDVLKRGCEHLGWHWAVIPRNVRGCWNLGYCGTGCPVNAKQSMLVTSLPAALERGAVLVHSLRAERLQLEGSRVSGVECRAMNATFNRADGPRLQLQARHVVLAGGAINSPALLLRSEAPDPHQRLGKRTFLHPVNFSLARFAEPINGFYGAPQSIYSSQFLWPQAGQPGLGFKLEVPPVHPSISAALLGVHGVANFDHMQQLAHASVMIALMRDGFDERSQGGQVLLRKDGNPSLDYPLTEVIWETVPKSWLAMAEIQFAAGAEQVTPLHVHARPCHNMDELRQLVSQLSLRTHDVRLSSAHVMGGCAMGEDPRQAVVDSQGNHHQLDNLTVLDGSLFPTSVGANPQLSIYALSAKLSAALASRLG